MNFLTFERKKSTQRRLPQMGLANCRLQSMVTKSTHALPASPDAHAFLSNSIFADGCSDANFTSPLSGQNTKLTKYERSPERVYHSDL
jgi:hypothetical protein